MIFKIAIFDDDLQNIKEIETQLITYEMKYNIDFEISTFYRGSDLLAQYQSPGSFHILFLDVEMPELNGLAIAEQIRNLPDRKAKIVFVSNYPEYMKDSFNVQAFHYLSKPFTADKCFDILQRIIKDFEQSNIAKLLVKTDLSEEVVYLEDIIQIECEDAKKQLLKVVLQDNDIICKGNISKWEKDLSEQGFISPCRGNLINIRHLHFIKEHEVIMTNGDIVSLSRRREKNVRNLFNHRLLILPN